MLCTIGMLILIRITHGQSDALRQVMVAAYDATTFLVGIWVIGCSIAGPAHP